MADCQGCIFGGFVSMANLDRRDLVLLGVGIGAAVVLVQEIRPVYRTCTSCAARMRELKEMLRAQARDAPTPKAPPTN